MPISPLAGRYLTLLSRALRNGLGGDSQEGSPPSLLELDRARSAIVKVVAEMAPEIARLRQSVPTMDKHDIVLRLLLLDPRPETVALFLRANTVPAQTLLAPESLHSLGELISLVVDEAIPGDLIECGVFRGGAAIYMRGVLAALEVTSRTVWLADSFQGLPQPQRAQLKDYAVDAYLREVGSFRVSLQQVREAFSCYGLLDGQVDFLPGWFEDTLGGFDQPLAVLRCDGDWYESTRTILHHLYDQVSLGGFVIIDDYSPLFGAVQAVDEFRASRGITSPLVQVYGGVHYWRK